MEMPEYEREWEMWTEGHRFPAESGDKDTLAAALAHVKWVGVEVGQGVSWCIILPGEKPGTFLAGIKNPPDETILGDARMFGDLDAALRWVWDETWTPRRPEIDAHRLVAARISPKQGRMPDGSPMFPRFEVVMKDESGTDTLLDVDMEGAWAGEGVAFHGTETHASPELRRATIAALVMRCPEFRAEMARVQGFGWEEDQCDPDHWLFED